MRTASFAVVFTFIFAACGREVNTATAISSPAAGSADAGLKKLAKPACAKGERKLVLAPDSQIRWLVVKSDGVPVVGTHTLSGLLVVSGDGALGKAALDLALSAEGPLSDLTLRDERLRRLLFHAQDALPFGFRLTKVDNPDGSPAGMLPEPGMSAQLVLAGELTLAGATVPVRIPIVLSALHTGLRVSEGVAGIRLDLRSTMKLGDAIDALMAFTAGLTLEDDVQLRLTLTLDEACRG